MLCDGAHDVGPRRASRVVRVGDLLSELLACILEGVIVGGGSSGKFEVQIDTVVQARIRTSGSTRTINTLFAAPFELIAGQVIDIKARNVGDLQATFEATIFGRVN